MQEPQLINSSRSDGKFPGQQADNTMKKAMASRFYDRLAQIDSHRASFRRHLSRAKNSSGAASGLSLVSEGSFRKTQGKERLSRRRVVNFALPIMANQQWDRKNGNDVMIVRRSKSSGYGSDTDRWNTSVSADSSVVSAKDDPHLAVPSWRVEGEDESEKGKDRAVQRQDSKTDSNESEDVGEEEIRRLSSTLNGINLLSQLEEEQEDSVIKRRQASWINRDKGRLNQSSFLYMNV
ncbi:hypothetical protein ElyMa_006994000 [Elysia marginata]|uniref:Uncharacterized protein n=1 Tax=Elysia marginata TaxID=1093978 RepID=A0AAV4JQV3_9GAST|nr:hypothetical protein ElyMa_006994000 [Elysia marginata]